MFAQRLALVWLLPPTVYFSPGLDLVDALLAALYHTEEPRETIHFVPGPQRGGRVEALRFGGLQGIRTIVGMEEEEGQRLAWQIMRHATRDDNSCECSSSALLSLLTRGVQNPERLLLLRGQTTTHGRRASSSSGTSGLSSTAGCRTMPTRQTRAKSGASASSPTAPTGSSTGGWSRRS